MMNTVAELILKKQQGSPEKRGGDNNTANRQAGVVAIKPHTATGMGADFARSPARDVAHVYPLSIRPMTVDVARP